MPNTGAGAANVEQTDLQRSIFDAPPPGTATATTTGSGLPAKPPGVSTDQKMTDAGSDAARGQKRTRDEEEEESDEDVAMEEDSDDE